VCGTLRSAAYPSACSNDVSTPPLPPPSPLPRIPQAMFTDSYFPHYDHGDSDSIFLSSFPPIKLILSTSERSCSPPVYHFTYHHEASVWFCLSRVPVSVQERPERHPGMCCLDPVLRLTTRSTGRAWRSNSRRFFFRFVSPRLVLLFHSFRTISLRFGESRLLWWLAHLPFSPIYSSSPLPVSFTG
jgi:hypothetical protein